MRLFALVICLFSMTALAIQLEPIVKYSESKYIKVDANTEDDTGGTVIPDGDTVAVYKIVANGSDPSAFVKIVYCHGDEAEERILASTTGDFHDILDTTLEQNQIIGDGVCKLQIILDNNNSSAVTMGGSYKVIEL